MTLNMNSLRARMTGRSRNDPANGGATELAQLSRLLEHDESTFVRAFDGLPIGSKKQLARDIAPGSLLDTAVALDKANAVMAMRPYATIKKTFAARPSRDAWLVEQAERSKQLRLTAALCDAHILDRTALATALRHAPPDAFVAFVAAHQVPPRLLAEVLPSFINRLSLATLRAWLQGGTLDLGQYFGMVASERSHAQGTTLILQSAAGDFDTGDVLDYLAPSTEQMLLWFQEGIVSFETLLQRSPELERGTVAHLWTAHMIDDGQYFRSGHASEQELEAWVQRRDYSAPQCMARYAISEQLAGRWLQAGLIDEQLFSDHRGACWQLNDPLPALHRLQAAQADDIHATLTVLPAPTDAILRRSLRTGLYATWIEAHRPSAPPDRLPAYRRVLGNPLLSWAGKTIWSVFESARGMPRSQQRLAPATECFACTDDIHAENPAVTFSGCAHPPVLHAECLRADFDGRISQGFAPRCPVSDCGVRPTLADAEVMGLDGRQREALALSIIHGFRTPNWIPCPTRGCISGADVATGAVLKRHCVFCELPVILRNLTREAREVKDLARLMIASMQDQGAGVTTRPCYHCGTATIRTEGCNTMTCGRDAHTDGRTHGCGQTWDFRTGLQVANGQRYGQAYVPLSGMLLRAGLYAPLRPGYIHRRGERLPGGHATLQDLVISNARALGWYPAD